MATLREYTDGSGYYVKDSFATNGRLFHVTYQLSDLAALELKQKGYVDGSHLPRPLVQQMIADKNLFTAASGVEGERLSKDEGAAATNDPFFELSPQAQMWVLRRVENHPDVRTTLTQNGPAEKMISFEGVPLHFMEQLMALARQVDGTDFFAHLDRSYKSPKGKLP